MKGHESQQVPYYELVCEANQEIVIVSAILQAMADTGNEACGRAADFLYDLLCASLHLSGRTAEWLAAECDAAQERLNAMHDRLRARDRDEAAGRDRCDLPFDPATGDIVCRRDPDGTIHTNVPHRVVRHSPSGFEWGYGGSGPAEFALNILLLFTSPEIADCLYQDFKWQFVATLPHQGGVIRGAEIRAWIADRCVSLASVDPEHHGRLWAVQARGGAR